MCDPVSAVVGGVLGAASALQGKKAAKAQKKAQAANEASAAKEAQRAGQAYNKANQRVPDIASLMAGTAPPLGEGSAPPS